MVSFYASVWMLYFTLHWSFTDPLFCCIQYVTKPVKWIRHFRCCILIPEFQFANFLINVFMFIIYFWLHGLFVATRAFPSCGERGLPLAVVRELLMCGGVPCCGAQAVGTQASVVALHRLSWSVAHGVFLGQGSNLCPPASAGKFLTTGPPKKSLLIF